MSKLPKIVYVTSEKDGDGDTDLYATVDVKESADGRVGVYELRDELDKRIVAEVRRPGTKAWFKPGK